MLLAKLWDKINAGIRRNIPASTGFLSPRELEMAKFLFGEPEGLYAFGGYADAERKMLVYLPEYLEKSALYDADSPCICLRATFYQEDTPNHRDFLGALMGAGIDRETVFIGHGDCSEDAAALEEMVREAGAKNVVTGYVGPVIGAHTGPGVLALFFLGEHR